MATAVCGSWQVNQANLPRVTDERFESLWRISQNGGHRKIGAASSRDGGADLETRSSGGPLRVAGAIEGTASALADYVQRFGPQDGRENAMIGPAAA
jgi:hypothetical protein